MSQDSILKALKRVQKPLTAKEIAIHVQTNPNSVREALKKLDKQNAVKKSLELLGKHKVKCYRWWV